MPQYLERLWHERLQSTEIKHVLKVKVVKVSGQNSTQTMQREPWLVYIKILRVYKGRRPQKNVLRVTLCEISAKPGDVMLVATGDDYTINFDKAYSGKEEIDALNRASSARNKIDLH